MDEFKKLLKEYVAIQSVSTDPALKENMGKMAKWLEELFKSNGFETQLLEGNGINPVVYASYKQSEDLKTVLVYGHYDVQPAEIEDGWVNDPFQLDEHEGRLYARGVMDNKGQNLIHIFSVVSLIKSGKLKYNVKFMIEGDEETGGLEELAEVMDKNVDILKADYVLVSDGELVAGKPAFDASYRGGCNLTVMYKVANNNVHSGIYGGAVANAGYELSKLLGKIIDSNNVVTIPGWYENVDAITSEQLENNSRLAKLGQEESLSNPGFKALRTENNQYDFYTQTGLRPTLQVTGIKCGYIGDGYSNIVPAKAEAKINFRIVASQTIEEMVSKFEKFVKENTPEFVDYEISITGKHDPVKLNTNDEMFKEVRVLLEQSYGSEVFANYVGGAIPFVAKVKELLGVDTIAVGLSNADCNMHGANENFEISLIQKGLDFSMKFFGK
jgi:acetylornithine deacetylase/succinyl-diaminopimelate desuccinylase-like protein